MRDIMEDDFKDVPNLEELCMSMTDEEAEWAACLRADIFYRLYGR